MIFAHAKLELIDGLLINIVTLIDIDSIHQAL
ncbi:Uncharacterised protein [Vibrio cholerae]|nr:Uncharacterised protein [Vibrio cholerae]